MAAEVTLLHLFLAFSVHARDHFVFGRLEDLAKNDPFAPVLQVDNRRIEAAQETPDKEEPADSDDDVDLFGSDDDEEDEEAEKIREERLKQYAEKKSNSAYRPLGLESSHTHTHTHTHTHIHTHTNTHTHTHTHTQSMPRNVTVRDAPKHSGRCDTYVHTHKHTHAHTNTHTHTHTHTLTVLIGSS